MIIQKFNILLVLRWIMYKTPKIIVPKVVNFLQKPQHLTLELISKQGNAFTPRISGSPFIYIVSIYKTL